MRLHILAEIRRLALANNGCPPGQIAFTREAGIGLHEWRGKLWAKWGDAVIEAGFPPNSKTLKADPKEITQGYILACRHYKRLPTQPELELIRQTVLSVPSPISIRRNFGSRSEFLKHLSQFVASNEAYSDISEMLPAEFCGTCPASAHAREKPDGFVYLIMSGTFYKIGRGADLEKRIKQIRVSLPDKASLVHSIRTDDPSGIEAYWHRRFAEKRANGEWFKLTNQDVAAFKKRKFQ